MDPYIRDCEYKAVNTLEVDEVLEFNNLTRNINNNDFFTLLHQNIRSLSKNKNELEILLSQIGLNFDCIVLTESWKIQNKDFFNMSGYEIFYNNGNINKSDGVIVYLRDTLNYVCEVLNIGEISVLSIQITSNNNKKVLVTAIYRAPSTCPNNFIACLKNYLQQKRNSVYDSHIIVGDININIKLENDDTVSEYLTLLNEYNFISMINGNTREFENTASCIDHIFLNSKYSDTREKCLPIILKSTITDHYSQIILMPFKTENTDGSSIDIKFIDYVKLKLELQNHNWGEFYKIKDVQDASTYFVKLLIERVKTNTKIIKQKYKNVKRKEWITGALVQSINKKNDLYKKYKENPNLYGEEFRNYRNRLNYLIKVTKINFFKKKIEKDRNCPKNLWKTIKSIDSHKKNIQIKQILTEKNDITRNEVDIANTFGKYFANVGQNLAHAITKPVNPPPQRKSVNHSMFLLPVTESEIISKIRNLKPRKAPGIDMIRSETLKQISVQIAAPLSHLINNIFRDGICPSEFKIAIIKPIFKKGDRNKPENYRPISIITNITKVFEMVLRERINNYLKKFDILSPKQFGFREGKSTQDAITYFTTEMNKALDDGHPAIGIFLDLSKAFDTVNHLQLLEALEDIGIRGPTNQLLKSYLERRKQYVQIQEQLSDVQEVQYGVPQGTVLGPLLFSVYLNNLLNISSSGTLISYADDTVIFYVDTSWTNLKEKIELDFPKIIDWFSHKILTVNFEKTKFVPFTLYKNNVPQYKELKIKSGNSSVKIESTDRIKYLGITIDRHARWDLHVNNVTNTLRCILYKFKYLKKILDTYHMKIIYFALVVSRLQYGILGWGGVATCYLKKLQTLQNKFIKITYGKDLQYSTDQLYTETKLLDIRQIYILNIFTYLYKNRSMLQNIDHSYYTRQKENLTVKIQTPHKRIGQRSLVYISRQLFNFISPEQRQKLLTINSLKLFKTAIKKYMIESDRHIISSYLKLH